MYAFGRFHCLNSSAKCPQSRQSGDTAAVTQRERIYRALLGAETGLRFATGLATRRPAGISGGQRAPTAGSVKETLYGLGLADRTLVRGAWGGGSWSGSARQPKTTPVGMSCAVPWGSGSDSIRLKPSFQVPGCACATLFGRLPNADSWGDLYVRRSELTPAENPQPLYRGASQSDPLQPGASDNESECAPPNSCPARLSPHQSQAIHRDFGEPETLPTREQSRREPESEARPSCGRAHPGSIST